MKNLIKTIKKLTLFLVLFLSLNSCNVLFKQDNSLSGMMDYYPEYIMFHPETKVDFEKAVQQGDISSTTLIAKTIKDFDVAQFEKNGLQVIGSFDLEGSRYYRLLSSGGGDTYSKSKRIKNLRGIYFVEHELRSYIPENEESQDIDRQISSKGAAEIYSVLNDPETWGRFGHFEITHAIDAYKNLGFGSNTVYAVGIDTGIDQTHEDFQSPEGQPIIEYAKSAFDQNGFYVGDGNPFITIPEGENWDENGHGTHTAGTIAAIGNNNKGVAGVAWQKVKLISYKCFSDWSPYSGYDWPVYGSLKDLVDWKIANNITQTIPVNMSLGGSYASAFELEMINYAFKNGIVIIASMGNDGTKRAQYPASYAGVIAVGAVRANGEKVGFSTLGDHISVSAPGYNIYSTYKEGKYCDMSGTSMSAPFVTGLVAYMLSYNPTLTADQIKTILEETATDIGDPGWDSGTGYGLVDVEKAIARVKNSQLPPAGSVYSQGTAKISVISTDTDYDSGISGFPDAIGGVPVYLYSSNGSFVALGVTNYTDGTVSFHLLKPGTYTARSNLGGVVKNLEFDMTNSNDYDGTLSCDCEIYYVQTLWNELKDPNYDSWADTVLTIYAEDGSIIAGPFDYGYLDTLRFFPDKGKTYVLKINPYTYSSYSYGEYGLIISKALNDSINSDNGRGSGPDDSFEDNDSFSSAANISIDTAYGLYLGDDDYFKFIIPE